MNRSQRRRLELLETISPACRTCHDTGRVGPVRICDRDPLPHEEPPATCPACGRAVRGVRCLVVPRPALEGIPA